MPALVAGVIEWVYHHSSAPLEPARFSIYAQIIKMN